MTADGRPRILGGEVLRNALGFRSGEAFRLAARQGRIPVQLFKVPGRRGWFARERDVSAWQAQVSASGRPQGGSGTSQI